MVQLLSTEESTRKRKITEGDSSGEQYEDIYVSVISWRVLKKSGTDEYDGTPDRTVNENP